MASFGYKKSIGNTYQAHRSFDNELFKHKKRPKKGKIILAFLLMLAITVGAGWLITRPFFFLQAVNVEGAETISPYVLSSSITDALEKDKFLGISRLHILRRHDSKVREALSEYSFVSIQVEQKKRILTVRVQEQAQGGLIHAMNTWSVYNLQGNYVRNLTDEEIVYVSNVINGTPGEQSLFHKDTPIIEFGNQEIQIDSKVLAFTQIKKMHDALIASGHRPIMHIISDEQMLWAEARMGEGYTLLYDLNRDTKEQIEQYAAVERELQKGATNISIVDIRFEGRVYTR